MERAYTLYPDGSCMYAVVASVIGALANQFGEPYRSFPVEMTRYGRLGIGQLGAVCGVINGGAMLAGLFYPEKDPTRRDALITELALWYETSALPQFVPAQPGWAEEVPAAVPGSVVCHISVANWCKASGFDAFCKEKKERCRRLSAEGAGKVVQLLNAEMARQSAELHLLPEVKECVRCHGERELADARGLFRCTSCHTELSGGHPAVRLTGVAGH
jgi:hypothetical protein